MRRPIGALAAVGVTDAKLPTTLNFESFAVCVLPVV